MEKIWGNPNKIMNEAGMFLIHTQFKYSSLPGAIFKKKGKLRSANRKWIQTIPICWWHKIPPVNFHKWPKFFFLFWDTTNYWIWISPVYLVYLVNQLLVFSCLFFYTFGITDVYRIVFMFVLRLGIQVFMLI